MINRKKLEDIIFELEIPGYFSKVGSRNLADEIADRYEKKECKMRTTIIKKVKNVFGYIDMEELEILEEEENIKVSVYVKIDKNKKLYKVK